MDEVIATMHPHTPPRTLPLPLTLPPPNQVIAAIDGHEHKTVEAVVVNTDRATGARIAGAVAKKHGNRGWRGSLHVIFTGCAGQSFGAYCLDGLDLEARPHPYPDPEPEPDPHTSPYPYTLLPPPLLLPLPLPGARRRQRLRG